MRATALDPMYADAMVILAHLYREKAQRSTTPEERARLLQLAESTYQGAVRVAAIRGGRTSRPDDQFSRPAPPPPPLWSPAAP